MNDIKQNPVLSVAVAVAMLLGGGSGAVSLIGNNDATAKATALEARLTTIEMTLTQIASDKETMSKHWKLHGWAQRNFSKIESRLDVDLEDWPDL